MTSVNVAGLLAAPARLRVFAAIALGSRTLAEVQVSAGASSAEVQEAVRRLHSSGLISVGADGMDIVHQALADAARAFPRPEPERFGAEDAMSEGVLRTFVRDGRLIDFPSQWEKKIIVLSYLAGQHFVPDRRYSESAVNEVLDAWCVDAPIDHVSVRRYLVDTGVLLRENAQYWRAGAPQ